MNGLDTLLAAHLDLIWYDRTVTAKCQAVHTKPESVGRSMVSSPTPFASTTPAAHQGPPPLAVFTISARRVAVAAFRGS